MIADPTCTSAMAVVREPLSKCNSLLPLTEGLCGLYTWYPNCRVVRSYEVRVATGLRGPEHNRRRGNDGCRAELGEQKRRGWHAAAR